MEREVISEQENDQLYASFSRTLGSYMVLMPNKYISLETICYTDKVMDEMLPRVLEEKPDWDKATAFIVANKLCIGSIRSGFLDQYCREVI